MSIETSIQHTHLQRNKITLYILFGVFEINNQNSRVAHKIKEMAERRYCFAKPRCAAAEKCGSNDQIQFKQFRDAKQQ
jgi:hypothetical protein